MKQKTLIKINNRLCDTVTFSFPLKNFHAKDLGKRQITKQIIELIVKSPKLKKKLLGKKIISVTFSTTPRREVNVIAEEIKKARAKEKEIKKTIRPILNNLRDGLIKEAEIKTARLILNLLRKFEKGKISSQKLSQYFDNLWWSKGFIEKMPEPINSAILEGADFNYYYNKNKEKESDYRCQEVRSILKYLKESAEKILKAKTKTNKK